MRHFNCLVTNDKIEKLAKEVDIKPEIAILYIDAYMNNLPPSAIVQYPTVEELKDYIAHRVISKSVNLNQGKYKPLIEAVLNNTWENNTEALNLLMETGEGSNLVYTGKSDISDKIPKLLAVRTHLLEEQKHLNLESLSLVDDLNSNGNIIQSDNINHEKVEESTSTMTEEDALSLVSEYYASINIGDITNEINEDFNFNEDINSSVQVALGAEEEQTLNLLTQEQGDSTNLDNLSSNDITQTEIKPTKTGSMNYSYEQGVGGKRSDVKSNTTLEAIQNGERTATTRYTKDGNIEYWSTLKVGDIVEWHDKQGNKVNVRITKPLTKLSPDTDAEEWSKKEGWSVEHFNQKVKPEIDKGEAYQMEFEKITEKQQPTGYTNHSGGATGSDFYWGKIGSKYGIQSKHYYHGKRTSYGNTQQSEEDFKEGVEKAKKAAKDMGRKWIDQYADLQARNWNQVKYADTIFAIGHIVYLGEVNKKGYRVYSTQVDGGTGYAVQMAINEGKDVYVFDQIKGEWYLNHEGKWSNSDTPILTKNFAGIGTREINEAGRKAIEEVYKNTFGESNPNLNNSAPAKNFEVTRNLVEEFGDTFVDEGFYQGGTEVPLTPDYIYETTQMKEGSTTKNKNEKIIVDSPYYKEEAIKPAKNERAALSVNFNPTERNDRTNYIARSFCDAVNENLEERQRKLNEEKEEKQKEFDTLYYNNKDGENNERMGELFGELLRLGNISELLADPYKGRQYAIQLMGVENIFNGIKNKIEKSKQGLIDVYNSSTDANKKEAAQRKAAAYDKMLKYWKPLLEDACMIIEELEKVKIEIIDNNNSVDTSLDEYFGNVTTSENEFEKLDEEFDDNEDGKRVNGNDQFGYKIKFKDPIKTLSKEVYNVLMNIPLLDKDGDKVYDDLGFTKYINPSYAHAALINDLSDMIDANDFYNKENNTFPALERLKEKYPWVKTVIKKLKKDKSLTSKFYSDLRKDFCHYTTQYIDSKTATINIQDLNGGSASESLFSKIEIDYSQRTVLNPELSLFDAEGTGHRVNFNNLEKINALYNEIRQTGLSYDNIATSSELRNKISSFFRSIGIDFSAKDVERLVEYEGSAEKLEGALDDAAIIIDSKNNNKELLEKNKINNFINYFSGKYRAIANKIGVVTDVSHNQTFKPMGSDSAYPSYSAPDHIQTLFKTLKSEEKSKNYIESKFGKDEWFKNQDTGEWRNEMLEQFMSDDENVVNDIRNHTEIRYRNILNNKEYEKWDAQEINTARVFDFCNYKDPTNHNLKSEKHAFYYFPIFADSPCMAMISMKRYNTEEIIPKMTRVFDQELVRIKRVQDRKEKIKKGLISPIANYDSIDGVKESKGEHFNFFPILDLHRATIINAINKYKNQNTGIIDTNVRINHPELSKLIDNGTDYTYQEFKKALIQYSLDQGFRNFYYSSDVNTEAIKYALNKQLEKEGAEYRYKERNELTDNTEDGAFLELLKNYYYNNAFATTQIIELTTVDLAFYKDQKDFQKRYKEVYAAGNKLNTNSEYGKEFRRSIYLKDEEITSSIYYNLKLQLSKAVEEGRITSYDRDNILHKFKNVNVTDAQAFVSLSSMRSILDMYGSWTKKMESAYNNIINHKWDMSDFNTIWQTIKPFVFTKISKPESLNKKDGTITVPHQNKNSEFLLLALWQSISASLDSSPYLKAINQFMEDNDIDVIQFESAVKVGGQGIIDLNYSKERLNNWKNNNSKEWNKIKAAAIKELGYKGDNIEDKYSDYEIFKAGNDYLLDNYNGKEGKEQTGISPEVYERRIKDIKFGGKGAKNAIVKTLESMSALKDENGNIILDENKKIVFNPEVVHDIPYDDYVIQQPTPEHLVDAIAVFGSQFRNLITADIDDNAEFVVNGKKYDKNELIKLYQALIIENLLDGWKKIKGKFASIESLQKLLQSVIEGNPKYGRDVLDAIQLVTIKDPNDPNKEKKVFNIPLDNPTTTTSIQEIINSVFKNNISRQTINGGNCILVSDVGLTHELKTVKNEDGSIKYMECYLPAYTKKFFHKGFFTKNEVSDQKDGKTTYKYEKLDISEIPEEVRKIIGYRIPTEDKYSMCPLYIKGFLPQQNGSSIMLPADVTTFAGSDFDVDKLFLMIPNINVKTINIDQAVLEFANEQNDDEDLKNLVKSHAKIKDIKTYIKGNKKLFKDFKEYIQNNKSKYELKKPIIKKIKYDTNKRPEEQDKKTRDNMLIDISYSILTHPDTALSMQNPGNFDKAKVAARILDITKDTELLLDFAIDNGIFGDTKDKSRKELKDLYKDNPIYQEKLMNKILEYYEKDDIKALDSFMKKHPILIDPLNPTTFTYFHRQNVTGGISIGIYANNTSMQAKYQNSGLAIKDDYTFYINDRKIKELDKVYIEYRDKNGNLIRERISKNCANFSAASVDNVKDPVLASLLQNPDTAYVTCFLLRAGVTIKEISLLFAQPIVRRHIEYRGSLSGLGRNIVKNYIMKMTDLFGNDFGIDELLQSVNVKSITDKELLSNILNNKLSDSLIGMKKDQLNNLKEKFGTNEALKNKYLEDYKSQLKAALLFLHIMDLSDPMQELTFCSRSDSPKAGIARTKAGAKLQVHKIQSFLRRTKDKDFVFENAGALKSGIFNANMPIDTLRERFKNSTLPILQGFYTLGIELANSMTKDYFIHDNPVVDNMVEKLFINSKYDTIPEETLNAFYEEFIDFALSGTELFGEDYEKQRNYYLYEYPAVFINQVKKNKELKDLSIFKKIIVENGKIIIKKGGKLDPLMIMELMSNLDSLLYDNNEEHLKLANDLFKYAYYSGGFKFGYKNYGQFFSTSFISSFPEFINTTRNLNNDILNNPTKYNKYLDMFYLNHFTECNLPSLEYADEAVTKDNKYEIDLKDLDYKDIIYNSITNTCYEYITIKKNEYNSSTGKSEIVPVLYAFESITSDGKASYVRVKTISDKQKFQRGVKYNINMSPEELADSEVNETLIAENSKLNSSNRFSGFWEVGNIEDYMEEDFFGDLEGAGGFEDIINGLERANTNNKAEETQKRVDETMDKIKNLYGNKNTTEDIYNPEDSAKQNGIKKC